MSNINQILADKLVFYRKQHHLTQEEVAEYLGVTFQAVSKWETARSAPDLSLLPMLADLFGCSIDALFGRTHDGTALVMNGLPWEHDDVYRAALFKGQELIHNGDALRKFTFVIEAETVEHLTVNGNADLHGNVHEGCTVNGNLKIDGDIIGDCGVGNNATVSGDIIGEPSVGNNLTVKGEVTGDCTAGNNVTAGSVKGDCSAGGNLAVDGFVVAESVNAGSVRIGGNVTLKGEAHVGILECGSISGGTVVIHEE